MVKRKSTVEEAKAAMWGQGGWGETEPQGRRRDVSSGWEDLEENDGRGARDAARSSRGGRARGTQRRGRGARGAGRIFHLLHSLAIGRERGGEGREEDGRREGVTDRQRREREERVQRRALRLTTGLGEVTGDVSSEEDNKEGTRLGKNATAIGRYKWLYECRPRCPILLSWVWLISIVTYMIFYVFHILLYL